MIISNSQIGMSAAHQRQHQVHERESLQRFETDAQGNVRVASSITRDNAQSAQRLEASALAARIERPAPEPIAKPEEVEAEQASEDIDTTEPRLRLLAAIVSMLSNREVELFDAKALTADTEAVEVEQPGNATPPPSAPGQTGMRYEWSREESISESTRFSAVGKLTTADGKSIDIALQLQMEYSYTERESLVMTAGVQMKDPLVINFNGSAAELSAEQLSFDIDADGELDRINVLSSNSGLLMLDKNGDGKASDGRELFGALSGNGFADLATYDEDGNGFIDEGDSVYGQLKIWIQGAEGADQYASLKEKDVGAIYLGSVSTPFSLYTEGNDLRGQIRSSGLYVGENGSVGTVQQIDLVV
ncbi:hypothetical protein KQ940_10705 [Marinobacterium sp. D7]|uniref:hypothetical protein n=1 Tax=Marinobacterium ramblicola TaxID=2849041 RepID=UPI001C2D04CC|nr:hypothetical protein [Marinobacterium ramblicola]MBV1788524.1 hypothetical protein [Marinobacterium ramblicola]